MSTFLVIYYFFSSLFDLCTCQNSVIYCQSIGTWAEWDNSWTDKLSGVVNQCWKPAAGNSNINYTMLGRSRVCQPMPSGCTPNGPFNCPGTYSEIRPCNNASNTTQQICPSGWSQLNGYCYLAIVPTGKKLTYMALEAQCAAYDASVASIHSDSENRFVQTLVNSSNPSANAIYIGLRRTNSSEFYFTDGTIFDYGFPGTDGQGISPWAPGKPKPGNVTQMLINNTTNTWNDTNQDVPLDGGVCKKPLQSRQLPALSGDLYAHDPTLVKLTHPTLGPIYYVYSTHNGLEARYSLDMITWVRNGSAFPNGVAWVVAYSGDPMEMWGPDIFQYNGTFYLNYCVAIFGFNLGAIGLATSPTGLPGSWSDLGMILSSRIGYAYSAIDSNILVDSVTGRWILTFGSFNPGISQLELNPQTGKLKDPTSISPTLVATRISQVQYNPIEGPFLFHKGGYYYLFTSNDFCCDWPYTYNIRVGRATSPNGPFVDRANQSLLQNGGTVVLAQHANVWGPGGQSILTDINGQDLMVYHYYDRSKTTASNQLPYQFDIKKLSWTNDGWPYLEPRVDMPI